MAPEHRAHIGLDDVRAAFAGTNVVGSGPPQAPSHLGVLELPPTADPRPAAVLCLLFEEGSQAHVVLTRRAAHLRTHASEVSFPGGRLAAGETALEAALREAEEEIAAVVDACSVIGQLTPLTTYRSPSIVQCFVATFPGPGVEGHGLRPQVLEVEKVFSVPLARLAGDNVFHEELWQGTGTGGEAPSRAVPFFSLDEDVVWGATGRLLFELLSMVLAKRAPATLP